MAENTEHRLIETKDRRLGDVATNRRLRTSMTTGHTPT